MWVRSISIRLMVRCCCFVDRLCSSGQSVLLVCITASAATVRVPVAAGKHEGKGRLGWAGRMGHDSVMLRLGSMGCQQLNVAMSGFVWCKRVCTCTFAGAGCRLSVHCCACRLGCMVCCLFASFASRVFVLTCDIDSKP